MFDNIYPFDYFKPIELLYKSTKSKYYKNLRIKNFDTLQIKKGEELYYFVTKIGVE